jgi:hypothetical protein
MERIYGKQAYSKSGHPNWNVIAKKPTFKKLAKQGANQCGFYCMKFAATYVGEELVEQIDDYDVCVISH